MTTKEFEIFVISFVIGGIVGNMLPSLPESVHHIQNGNAAIVYFTYFVVALLVFLSILKVYRYVE
jgi:hypothetical protein